MLGVNNYSREYIDACQAKMAALIASYDSMLATAASVSSHAPGLVPAIQTLEAALFNNLVITLDAYFVHRLRAMELKDGNPLNEVRMLCNSLLLHGGVMTGDKTIKMDVSKSVLGYGFGDEIRVDRDQFGRISSAFFAEIIRKFS